MAKESIRIIGSDGAPHYLQRSLPAIEAMHQWTKAHWDQFEGVALESLFDDSNTKTIQFNLFFTMDGIAESLRLGAMDQERFIDFGYIQDGKHRFTARFTTDMIGRKDGKTITIFENTENGQTELFRINVIPLIGDYAVKAAGKHSATPMSSREDYNLTPRDNAILQILGGILRTRRLSTDVE